MIRFSNFQYITNPTLSETEQVKQVCEGGGRWIQLRLKDKTEDEIIELGQAVAAICKQYNATFILNDYPHLVKKIGANGVHLGKNDMPPSEARELLGAEYIIGGTANTFEDIQSLHQQKVDYIGLGPFRFTSTKKNLSPIVGLEGYRTIMNQCKTHHINIPTVAIGGIDTADVTDIMTTGVQGIAISSAVTGKANPIEATQCLITQITNSYEQA
ncbi:thiamine phosphate synthase [Puteibacter caeruleilacunae]|nr:thiamine phosphate synthase [Puteibacter caeruleilacunae]